MDKNKFKYFQVRLPKDVWHFIKKQSEKLDVSMTFIIAEQMIKYKEKQDKKKKK